MICPSPSLVLKKLLEVYKTFLNIDTLENCVYVSKTIPTLFFQDWRRQGYQNLFQVDHDNFLFIHSFLHFTYEKIAVTMATDNHALHENFTYSCENSSGIAIFPFITTYGHCTLLNMYEFEHNQEKKASWVFTIQLRNHILFNFELKILRSNF